MAQPPRRRASFRVRFDELAFAEDLRHATPSGRQVGLEARRRLERNGADVGEQRPCAAEARDGTRLPNCVKTYLPDPAGRWRMIFEVVRDPESREFSSHTVRSASAIPSLPTRPIFRTSARSPLVA